MCDRFVYYKSFLDLAQQQELLDFFSQDSEKPYLVGYRAGKLKARPKREYAKNATDDLIYRYGQHKNSYRMGKTFFPRCIEKLAELVGDENINHVIATEYLDGKENHIPWVNQICS